MQTENQMLTQLETVRAASKSELYQKLFEQCGKHYYHIIDQTEKRKFPLFWKKEYELKVMVMQEEEKSGSEGGMVQDVQHPKDEGVQHILRSLETKTSEFHRKSRAASFDPAAAAAKKKELLNLLKTGFSMYDEAERTMKEPVEQKVKTEQKAKTEQPSQTPHSKDIEELQAAIALMQEQTDEKEREELRLDTIERFSHLLRENDVDDALIAAYTQGLQKRMADTHMLTEEEMRAQLLEAMAGQFKTAPLLDADENKMIVLFGPTGVGKTTTISKLGWQFYKKKKSFGFITTDVFRSGAIQQLQGYADLMQSELRVAAGKEELREAVNYFRHVKRVDHILIDTAGRNYMDEDSVEEVQEYMEILQPDIACLTFSASMRKKDVLTVLTRFQQVGANCLIVTKLDETESIGEWLSVSNVSDIPILFVTNGQNITKHIHIPTGEWLAERVLSKDVPLQGEIFDLRTDE